LLAWARPGSLTGLAGQLVAGGLYEVIYEGKTPTCSSWSPGRAIVFDALSGWLGVAIIAAALLVAVVLEVGDQRAAPVTSTTDDDQQPRRRTAVAALVPTAVRILVVVR
jgi:hypothetical protein